MGLENVAEDGIVARAIRHLKARHPELLVLTDVCCCEYTNHGHCGILTPRGAVDNDRTLEILAQVAVAHARAGADVLATSDAWARAERFAAETADGLRREAAAARVPLTVQRVGTMFTAFFTATPVTDHASAKATDAKAFGRFFHAMLAAGVYLPPSAFEAGFTSAAHGPTELDRVLTAARAAFRAV